MPIKHVKQCLACDKYSINISYYEQEPFANITREFRLVWFFKEILSFYFINGNIIRFLVLH